MTAYHRSLHGFRRDLRDEDNASLYHDLESSQQVSAAVQRECGCVIGKDYPAPIVDHAVQRQKALAAYEAAAKLSRLVPRASSPTPPPPDRTS